MAFSQKTKLKKTELGLIPEEWDVSNVGYFCSNMMSGGTPSRSNINYYEDGKICWVKTGELNNSYIQDTEEKITHDALKNSSAKLLPKNTVSMAMYGATVGKLGILGVEASTNQACCNMITNKDSDFKFLFYSLLNKREELISRANGAAQQNLNIGIIKNFPLVKPPLKQQQQIAEILSSLDDKIELNRRINANLEAVASALFKRWFIDFGFPDKNGQPYKTNNGKMLTSELGPIPDGWSINQAQELFDFTKGIEPGNKNYTSIESEITIPFFRVADLFNGNQSKTYINKSIAGTVITSNNDVLIATDGTVGRVATGLYGSYSGGIKKVISKDKSIGNSFIYFWLKSSIVQNKLKEYASSATTIAHASGAIKDLKIAYNKEIIKKFCVLSQPIFEEIINNLSENIKIKKVIDLLLPRLMSGKIKA